MPSGFGRFKRILVPVDFSLRAANALAYAVALGSRSRAEIDVVHVWHSDLATGVTLARERAKSELRDFVAELELRGDVTVRRRVELGDPYLTIQRLAQLTAFDLLVVAGPEPSHGAASVARSLIRSASTPVLFVPAQCLAREWTGGEPVLSLERIVVPLALAGAQLSALDCAQELAEVDHARIEVLLTPDASPAQIQHLRLRPQLAHLAQSEHREGSEQVAPRRVQSSRFDLLIMAGPRAPVGENASDMRQERIALAVPCPSLSLLE